MGTSDERMASHDATMLTASTADLDSLCSAWAASHTLASAPFFVRIKEE